jgi:hypothetical protein
MEIHRASSCTEDHFRHGERCKRDHYGVQLVLRKKENYYRVGLHSPPCQHTHFLIVEKTFTQHM